MTQEQKAKAYDEVRDKIALRFGSNVADEIFSKFEESEDERIRKALLEMVHDTTGDELWVDYNVHKEEALAWLEKQGGQNPAWSEEDKRMIESIIKHLERQKKYQTNTTNIEQCQNWVKSLEDRVQPQQEWTEEDEKKRTLLIRILEVNHPNGYFKVNPANTLNMEAMPTEELVSWLKSFKPQNRWKPSDKQLKHLKQVVDCSDEGWNVDILYSLYEDLKKL